jgi:antitoxin component YwqK of YwqJK toxin-antitoxin module
LVECQETVRVPVRVPFLLSLLDRKEKRTIQHQAKGRESNMQHKSILDSSDIRDEAGRIRPSFPRQEESAWVPDGPFTALRPNGTTLLEISYREGVVHGPYVEFWSNGTVACEGQFNEGKQEGIWHFYNEDGSVMEILHFKDGRELPGAKRGGNQRGCT